LPFGKIILICIAATGLNLIGATIARTFNLPLFLDTGGTIFIAMLSGYVPGIVVGFVSNLLNSCFDESAMYFCSISIFIAIYVTFMARRGYYKKFFKAVLTIPALVLITTLSRELIEKFLFCTGIVQIFNEFGTNFPEIFLQELCDKGIIVLLMFFVVKFIPLQVKKVFNGLGRRQAPLSLEMKHAINHRGCPRSSLRTKMLLILTLSAIFIAASIASISYKTFKESAEFAQINIGDGLATIIVSQIVPQKVDEFINMGHASVGYDYIEKNLRGIKNSNSNIKSLYVYKITEESCRVVFDLNSPKPGAFVELEEVARPYKNDFIAGRPIPPIISDDAQGYMLTIYKPVYDNGGKCQCYAAIKLSMDLIPEYGRAFIAKVMALFSGCFIFVFVVGLRFVENNVTLPVNTMAYCARNFAYDKDEFCAQTLEQIKSLKIHTGDEIENLYVALLKMTQDVMDYFYKLRQARIEVAVMDELAHKDSLTGIKNKAAYDEATARLDEKISDSRAEFCIVMIDVNFLKKINDTYGHERGNIYLMNAVKLICAVFGEEHVYRIGGDEFVVILEGDKVSLCKYFVEQFKAEMTRKNSNESLQAWEKVSAAVGSAIYNSSVDKTADEVFKRADKEMYENKLAMKAARSD